MKQKHVAIAAGLALSIASFVPAGQALANNVDAQGGAGSSTQAEAASGATDAADSPASGEELPAPADYDKADFYEGAPDAALFSLRTLVTPRLSPVNVSDEMKYFTRYESGRDYDKGFSYGDGYNALGYYQFDRRYSLIPFMKGCVGYDSEKYAMFDAVIDRASEVQSKSVSMYDKDAKRLTELGRLVEDAWHAAYKADPAEFAALQDSYACNEYYMPSERWLKTQGVDISGRSDCVKGLVWSATNLFGAGGVRDFFNYANLSNDMSDEEFVTALCDAIVDNVAKEYPSQPQYHAGWQNRYRKEKADCLKMLAAAGGTGGSGSAAEEPAAPETPADPGASDADEPGSGDASGSDDGATDGPDTGGSQEPEGDSGSEGESDPSDGDGAGASDDGSGNASAPDAGGSDDGTDAAGSQGGDDAAPEQGDEPPAGDQANGDGATNEGVDSGNAGSQGGSEADVSEDPSGSTTPAADDRAEDPSGDASGQGADQDDPARAAARGKKLLPETGDTMLMTVGGIAAAGVAAAAAGIAIERRSRHGK